MRTFRVTLWHGHNNEQVTMQMLVANTAADAVKEFVAVHFPAADVYPPGRVEKPFKGKAVFSFGTSASGQRIYCFEE